MKDLVNKIFSSKRTNSEYLKYEDGDIVTIEKVTDPDNAPKLDVQGHNQSNSSGSPSGNSTHSFQKSYNSNINPPVEDKNKHSKFAIKLIGGLLLLSLLAYVANLAFLFVNRTKQYVETNNATVQQGQVQQNQGKTPATNTNTNQSTNNTPATSNNQQSTGTINTNPQQTVDKPIDYKEVQELLKATVDNHTVIASIITDEKSDVIEYMNGRTNMYLMKSKLSRNSITLGNQYRSLQAKKAVFDTYNAQNLYLVLLQRLDNALDLVNKLNATDSKDVMVSTLNEKIVKENDLVNKQLSEFKSVLDKNYIKYTVQNGQLTWTISEK